MINGEGRCPSLINILVVGIFNYIFKILYSNFKFNNIEINLFWDFFF